MDKFSLQSLANLPSQAEWLWERAQPPFAGVSRQLPSAPGRSPLLGDASLLPSRDKTVIPQASCTPLDGQRSLQLLQTLAQLWQSQYDRLTLLSVTLESPVAFPQSLAQGGLQGDLPGPHTPRLCRQVHTADLGASPSPGSGLGAGKAESLAKLRNKQVGTCTALGI